jgi:hypothetical protein
MEVVYMMRSESTRPTLLDLSDRELRDEIRKKAPRLVWSYSDCREELFRRSQDRNADIIAQWTKWISIATIVNVFAALVTSGATLYQIWWGWF